MKLPVVLDQIYRSTSASMSLIRAEQGDGPLLPHPIPPPLSVRRAQGNGQLVHVAEGKLGKIKGKYFVLKQLPVKVQFVR